MKRCSKCQVEKEDSCFSKSKSKKSGLTSRCKECVKADYVSKREDILADKKLYYAKNKDRLKEANKKYRIKNIDKIRGRKKEFYTRNRDSILQEKKEYLDKNRNEINSRRKVYRDISKEKLSLNNKLAYEKNKEKYLKNNKKYRKANADKLREKKRKYLRDRYAKDFVYRLTKNMRRRIGLALNGTVKSDRTTSLLGCSVEQLKIYLESKFQEGMTWDNYGTDGWHVDHIKPCDAFDLTDPEQQRKCFHYTNLQPLWAIDNLKKGNRVLE